MKRQTQIIVLLFTAFVVVALLALLTHWPALTRVMPVILVCLLIYIGWLLAATFTQKKPTDPNPQPTPKRNATKKTKH